MKMNTLTEWTGLEGYGYGRFSSDDQERGDSHARRTKNITDDAESQSILLKQIMFDDGYSAFKEEQFNHRDAKLARYLREVDKGKHTGEVFIAERLDRISRSPVATTLNLLTRLLNNGVRLRFPKDGIFLTTVNELNESRHVVLVAMKVAMSHEDSVTKADRIGGSRVRALEKIRASDGSGSVTYYTKVPRWLKLVKDDHGGNKWERVEEQIELVQEIFRLKALGFGIKIIGSKVSTMKGAIERPVTECWLSRTLRSRNVLGEIAPKIGPPIPNYYPVIIDPSVWEKANKQLDANLRKVPKAGFGRSTTRLQYKGGSGKLSTCADNLFSGLVWDVSLNSPRVMYHCSETHKTSGQIIQEKLRTCYDSRDQTEHYTYYQPFEAAVLKFFRESDWNEIADYKESEPLIEFKAKLKAIHNQRLGKERLIALDEAAVTQEEDEGARRVGNRRIAKMETERDALIEEEKATQHEIDQLQTKTAALRDAGEFVALLHRNVLEDNDTRMEIRRYIRDRVASIELMFPEDYYLYRAVCGNCGRDFTSHRLAKFCSGACRVSACKKRLGIKHSTAYRNEQLLVSINFINGYTIQLLIDGNQYALLATKDEEGERVITERKAKARQTWAKHTPIYLIRAENGRGRTRPYRAA